MTPADAPRLEVEHDRSDVAVGEAVHCRVLVTPPPGVRWAMLLAEVGLPPGAEVDRAALERAVESDRSIGGYEILPDRVVVYLWSEGVTRFELAFRPRLAFRGKTAPSSVFDYYNPDAREVIAPRAFTVRRAGP